MPDIITRDEAYARGLKRFYTGQPCKNGHTVERFVSSGGCVDCVNRKTPKKPSDGYVAANRAWPAQPITFAVNFRPTLEEMQGAIKYAQEMRWLDSALQAVHDDPALLARYMPRLTQREVLAMIKTQERYATQLEVEAKVRSGELP